MRLTSFFTTRTLLVFFTGFIAAFLMVVVPHMRPPKDWVTPFPAKVDTIEQLKPRLWQKPNDFQIKKQNGPRVLTGADYNKASAYGIVDLDTAEVLYQKNFSERLPIASLTKIMTAVVALDLALPDEQFIVSEKASVQIPTKVMLKPNEKYSLEFLLKSALISSANDSAQVIKEGIDEKYKDTVFIKAMNEKTRFLGMKNTNFSSAEGYDSLGNYSTVEDLAILSRYALTYPLIGKIVAEQVDDLTDGGSDMRFYLQNWNGLLGVYPGVGGMKIGNTDKAGYTTIVESERGGHRILAVLLGAPGVIERDLWASQLLDLGFENYGMKPVGITEDQLKTKYSAWKYFN